MAQVITLDGLSGVGKTAVGLEISKRLDFHFISLGSIYRALAWCLLQKIPLENVFPNLTLTLQLTSCGASHYLPQFNNSVLDRELYGDPLLEDLCAKIAQNEEIRSFVNNKVLSLNVLKGLVVEGRSANKVFPMAACKIYLTASPEERQKRNLQENRRIGVNKKEDSLHQVQKERDLADQVRQQNPLRFSSGMVIWDSTYSTLEETTEQLMRWLEHHLDKRSLFISIIIPVYNRAEHLQHCLTALTNQTIPSKEYEIIVVDDGSTDNTAEIGRQFGADIIKTSNKGPGSARNRGLERAKGDLILFLDADIITPPDYLEQVRLRHSLTNRMLLIGARRHLPEGVTDYKTCLSPLDSREKLLRRYSFCLSHLNHPWSLAYTCNMSFPRHLVKNIRFDESFTGWGLEDIDFAFQMYTNGAKLSFSRSILGYHLFHDRTFSENRYQGWLANLEKLKRKHSNLAIQSFSLFAPVFDPKIKANYFDVFDQFENRPLPESDVEVWDLTKIKEDVYEWIQNKLYSSKNSLSRVILLDDDLKTLHEVYLPFLQTKRIEAFIPIQEWSSVESEFKERFFKAKKTINNIKNA